MSESFPIFIISPVAIFGMYLHYRMLKILENRHFKVWEELGKPSLFLNNNISNNLTTLRFIALRRYVPLKDENLTKLCNFIIVFDIFYLVGFCIFFVVISLGWLNK